MLNRQDCYKILFDMKEKGIDVTEQISQLSKNVKVPLQVIKFINENRELNVTTFYESLRKKHNEKTSKLYLKIMKEDLDANECLKTLSSYVTQVLIASEKIQLSERKSFLESSHILQVISALHKYFASQELLECLDILKIIKSDIKILENKEI